MQINVSKLTNANSLEFKGLEVKLGADILEDYYTKVTDILMDITLSKTGKIILAEGIISYKLSGECYRCTEMVSFDEKLEFSERFVPAGIKDPDTYGYSGNVILIDNLTLDALLLNMPGKLLCKDNCLGLCSQCGSNLNYETCTCKEDREGIENPANPFFELKKLKRK